MKKISHKRLFNPGKKQRSHGRQSDPDLVFYTYYLDNNKNCDSCTLYLKKMKASVARSIEGERVCEHVQTLTNGIVDQCAKLSRLLVQTFYLWKFI